MTKEEIIELARGMTWALKNPSLFPTDESLIHFANLLAAKERERCAKLADAELMNTSALMSYPPQSSAAWNIASAIRSLK